MPALGCKPWTREGVAGVASAAEVEMTLGAPLPPLGLLGMCDSPSMALEKRCLQGLRGWGGMLTASLELNIGRPLQAALLCMPQVVGTRVSKKPLERDGHAHLLMSFPVGGRG